MEGFHKNTKDISRQIKFLLSKFFKRNKKKELIDCLELHGYAYKKITPEDTFEEVPYFEITNEPGSGSGDFESSYADAERVSSNIYGFNRTFITQPTDKAFKRLYEVQQYTTPDEMDFIKTKELVDKILNVIPLDFNFEAIKSIAMNMYLNITKVYSQTNLLKGKNKGGVKQGYTLLIIYYSLISKGIYIPRDTLVGYFNQFETIYQSDIPRADKNIKMIFENIPGYEFIFNGIHETTLCNMRPLLKEIYSKEVQALINKLKNEMVFNNPATLAEVAASITYIIKKHNLKLKVKCGVTDDTIRKILQKIK